MKVIFIEKGKFLVVYGPAKTHSDSYSNIKLCFTATDQDLLKEILTKLCKRQDAFFVKYSKQPRAGMYLGRCFLTTDEAHRSDMERV